MSGFSADWLQLREPVDGAARNAALVEKLRRADRGSDCRRIVDLATGTGANLRYLAPRLGGTQDWLLVDRDAALLDELPERMAGWAARLGVTTSVQGAALILSGPAFECRVHRIALDLAADLDRLEFRGRSLVTASALLDLVSERWLRRLAERCREAGVAVLFTLTYDGQIHCCPALAADTVVADLINRHQRTDKGFGPALGPHAATATLRIFRQLGYRVSHARSPWRLGPHNAALQDKLVAGWAAAATEIAPVQEPQITTWAARRGALIARGRSWVQVGHDDMLGWPARNASLHFSPGSREQTQDSCA